MSADPPTEPGLRERKKRATRTALSHATIRLGIERGWSNVTVEEIATAAGVSERTFRNYFPGKAAAVTALHLDRMIEIADDLRTRPASEPFWHAVTDVLVKHFVPPPGTTTDHPARDRQGAAGMRLLLDEPALRGEMAKANATAQAALAAAIAERTGTDAAHDVYPSTAAAVIGAASAVAVEHALRFDPPAPLEPILRDVLAQIAAGLPAPHPGARDLDRSAGRGSSTGCGTVPAA
ncbi:acyl-CoA-like ligand-binding transcription factor [Conexibacter woesei]|uniref:Transcriptional regulator, TetR family n=1 Tax=Conexibacter woesei (strain DSM 14684 / CCUG 47730 / CIP 108061 / JCM 11494 / NBRC 100937 / ID131577) TaxID=469383 RepID=D3F374_CONWI|nr:TetR family transcriptional regulator [Conexibacter woesei]ADB50354.1 transcriptional regulator, TetR family [Conexibacter woesei DSM 14684]